MRSARERFGPAEIFFPTAWLPTAAAYENSCGPLQRHEETAAAHGLAQRPVRCDGTDDSVRDPGTTPSPRAGGPPLVTDAPASAAAGAGPVLPSDFVIHPAGAALTIEHRGDLPRPVPGIRARTRDA
ncbi:hypothetical protein GCM10010421_22060 [Streptomyces glaucus]|uniref:Uncharacterized protein n=1 Tax=Streptomyces glaucus TaxID=284029 RepID=A0ABP5WSY7_9ACTN